MPQRHRGTEKSDVQGPKSKIGALLVAVIALLLPAALLGQPLSFPARHEHLNGSCRGTLVFADDGIRYEGAPHAARWPYAEIQELHLLDTGRVRILTYQDSPWRLGADRAFSFKVDGDLRQAAALLGGKLERRLVTGFAGASGKVLARFSVKHLRPWRGDEGTLVFAEDSVSYQSGAKGESRTWTYDDIESIATSDVFHLSLTTYEHQELHYASRRVFNFQLKEPLREETYNLLWKRVNRRHDLELFERLRSEVEEKTAAALARSEEPLAINPPVARIPPIQEPLPLSPPRASSAGWASPQVDSMKRILREEGLPEAFIGVVKVESGFNPLAVSPRNARGLWQFIPGTARRYGLRVDAGADERIDPEKSTRAAARYLKDLYAMFGDWKLALAGYNAGENRVQAARSAAGTSNFEALARLLPRETRRYVPAVLAALDQPLGGGWAPPTGRLSSRGYRILAPTLLFAP